ncbi:MAG: hypothetical protein KGQ40_15060, partial [Rhodospirillales bacterium]|nr:hypothetical protein [Rhodospirillales bacterium]
LRRAAGAPRRARRRLPRRTKPATQSGATTEPAGKAPALPADPSSLLPALKDTLQIIADLAIILLAIAAWLALRGRGANPVQIDIDMQVLDIGNPGELIGELMVVLSNVGPRPQRIANLFVEVRPSRHVANSGVALLPAGNMVMQDDPPIALAPGLRHTLSWTFEIPREERLLRATALINTGKWLQPDLVPALSQKHFWQFGRTARYTSRVFEVSASAFRRF